MDEVLPGAPGSLGVGHPPACEALAGAATGAGARIERGVEAVEVELGCRPAVRYRSGGGESVVQLYVQGVAGIVALWPLAYAMWKQPKVPRASLQAS